MSVAAQSLMYVNRTSGSADERRDGGVVIAGDVYKQSDGSRDGINTAK